MSQNSETQPTAIDPDAPAAVNPAVARCCQAHADAAQTRQAAGDDKYNTRKAAAKAYRLAMPTLSSEDSIHDFIACVAHGILIGAFEDRQATQLLYAAQVASGALARTRKSQKRSPLRPAQTAT
jgi:hypothetical protein